jgi:hypothetical protein
MYYHLYQLTYKAKFFTAQKEEVTNKLLTEQY